MAGFEIAKRCDRLQFLLCTARKHGCACVAFVSRHGPMACARELLRIIYARLLMVASTKRSRARVCLFLRRALVGWFCS